ncbi:MAG: cytochrome b/b6 domain-containing protein [Planctomycetota bacterium]|jgi:formate dehydrogenase gamma subunit
MKRAKLILALLTLASISFPAAAAAQEATAAGCSECHNGEADRPLPGPPSELVAQSTHASLSCADCHVSISMADLDREARNPHGPGPHPVNCGECHEEEAEVYKKHGRMEIGKDPDIPKCWSCHGHHDILPSSDTGSYVHRRNLAHTCMSCHTDVDLVKEHDMLAEAPIRLYQSSVHGRATQKGLYAFATCSNCHSGPAPDGTPTAHHILGPADPESTIYHFKIPDTCGQCHEAVTADFWEGVHGQLVKRGEVDAPVCTTCHGEHGIIKADDPASPVSAAHVAQQTCAPCHESVVLNEKYGIPGGRLKSYVDSYHGHKAKAGDVAVANCASCHGAHRILPSSDPTSSIHKDNLQDTCGRCHPGISAQLAEAPIHTTATGLKVGWPHFFRKFYIVLIVVTIGLMLLHNIADWIRHIKQMGRKPFVIRLSTNETMQHWALMVSFIVLVISGFALRFSEAWWVRLLFGWGEGRGFEFRGTIHRIAAVLFVIVSVWHIFYLFTSRGWAMFREMIANKRDLVNIKENSLYFLGRREAKPRFGRFTYMEKCEYWAMVWGAVIMAVTGVLLWFDDYFITRWGLPKGVLDVMLVIHYYEAWLATLAIFVWHIYGTIFSPSAYPMNPAWISGKMPRDMYLHEHPEGPKLKARIVRPRFEEETEDDGSEPLRRSTAEQPPKMPVGG